MSKAAYCTACEEYVWLGKGGGCVNGHAAPCLRDPYDAEYDSVTGKPSARYDYLTRQEPPTMRQAAAEFGAGIAALTAAAARGLQGVAARVAQPVSHPAPGDFAPPSLQTPSAQTQDTHVAAVSGLIASPSADRVETNVLLKLRGLIWHAFEPSGRFSRGEFAIVYLGSIGLSYILVTLATAAERGQGGAGLLGVVAVLWYLFQIPLVICAGIRRVHDLGKPGTFLLWAFVPLVNLFMIFYLLLAPGAGPDGLSADSANSPG